MLILCALTGAFLLGGGLILTSDYLAGRSSY